MRNTLLLLFYGNSLQLRNYHVDKHMDEITLFIHKEEI